MSNHWFKLGFVVLVCATVAQANHENTKGAAMSGHFEGGVGHSWTPGGRSGAQFFVDGLHLKNNFEVSSKTKVVLHNAFGIQNASNGPGRVFNGSSYFSGATLTAGSMSFSNLAAYIQHECGKGFYTSVGNMVTPLGMENLWDRHGMHSYYYSPAYNAAQGLGWNYDLAVKFHLIDILPGSLEVSLLDGRTVGGATEPTPGLAARWHVELKGGDWSLTPVVSTMLQGWRGSPQDVGITAGAMYKMGTLWFNAEWYYVESATAFLAAAGAGKHKAWNIVAEPGVDLGFADLSVKYAFVNGKVGTGAGTTDHTIGAAISKTYEEDKYRVKLAYQHTNLSGKLGAHVNDLRVLFATKW